MGRKKARYENAGNIKSVYTVNFREPEEIIQIIQQFKGITSLEDNLAILYIELQNVLDGYEFSDEQKTKLQSFTVKSLDGQDIIKNEETLSFFSNFLDCLSPEEKNMNLKVMEYFLDYMFKLPVSDQAVVYGALEEELNKVLLQKTKENNDIQNFDLEKLLKTSATELYKHADERLKVFIDAAVKTDSRYASDENKNNKRISFCSNIVENFLKARNLKYVSLSGLSVMTLMYIFSGRSKKTCNLFSTTGAKGNVRLVTEYVLPNSKETSYRVCQDGVTVLYSFDNAQKLFKQWRLHGSTKGKALAMVTTSIVHCYPDGLLSSDVQYTLKHSPMQWLHSFEVNKSSSYLVEKLDGDVLRSLINISESEEDIVLGRFDFDIDSAIKHVKDEMMDQGKDIIDIMIDVEKKELEKEDKFCEDGHRNVNPRANQIKCKVCKKNIFKKANLEKDEEFEALKDSVKQITVKNDGKNGKMHEILISDIDVKMSKAKLYPRVRNRFNENQALYISQGTIFANPNSFSRVKFVLRGIKGLTGTSKEYNSSVTFVDKHTVKVKTWGVTNMRTWIGITVDGLPHKLLIEVIKHSFVCGECEKDFDVMSDVTEHFQKHGHRTYLKEFGNCIIKIGGLHAEMNMLRSYVSLSWKIYYSYLCKAIGFVTPKAQLMQAKVTDMHKGWDTFISQHLAIFREVAKLFVNYCIEMDIDANADTFEAWENNVVKNPNVKMMIHIQKYFGTGIWLYRAGTRSNDYKLIRAGIRVFAGLFHINGNLNYSVIELYDDYLMTAMEKNNPELFNHFYTRMVTNLKNVAYCSESHDARHEEANKRAQNLLAGRDLEEVDLAFRVVDDLEELRSKYLHELSVEDRSKETSIVIPDYEERVRDMRLSLRKSGYLNDPYSEVELILIDGDRLNKDLLELFPISNKGKIDIFEEKKNNETSIKEMEEQIYILLHCIEDKEDKDLLTELFLNEKQGKPAQFFERFLNALVDQSYSNLIET